MNVPFSPVWNSYALLSTKIDSAMRGVFNSGQFILGRELTRFENEFADYIGVKHSIGVSSGLDALHLVLRAWEIGKGDEVIVPAQTFIATWLAVSYTGATPVPVDVDVNTFNINPRLIEPKISSKTKAIIPVHLFGQPAEMNSIKVLAAKYNLKVLEDSAQAHGSLYKGQKCGGLGDAGAFSFYPTKNLGAFGDGGAITTNDSDLYDKLISLRNYGSDQKYIHTYKGFNNRLDEIQAAILSVKLKQLDEWNGLRAQAAERYLFELGSLKDKVCLPITNYETKHAWHQFVIRCKERNALKGYLAKNNIETLVHYPVPPYKQQAYKEFNDQKYPAAEETANTCLSLPMSPFISEKEQNYVVQKIKNYFEEN